MRALLPRHVSLAAVAFALLAACGDNEKPAVNGDAGVDAGPLAACLDRPDELSRPPSLTGQLPCELLPPGFVAK